MSVNRCLSLNIQHPIAMWFFPSYKWQSTAWLVGVNDGDPNANPQINCPCFQTLNPSFDEANQHYSVGNEPFFYLESLIIWIFELSLLYEHLGWCLFNWNTRYLAGLSQGRITSTETELSSPQFTRRFSILWFTSFEWDLPFVLNPICHSFVLSSVKSGNFSFSSRGKMCIVFHCCLRKTAWMRNAHPHWQFLAY